MARTSPASASFPESGSQYVEQLSAAWRNGSVTAVEQFFAEYPECSADTEIAVRLIYEEFCLRQEAGQDISPEEMLQRFPQWRSKLAMVLDCHQLVLATTHHPEFPALGEQFGEFRLLAELGRGAAGRVFLATQPSLSDRPVVVKIVPSRGSEHLSLARLQHTSIVPLYFVQEHPDKHLRLLCMPYVGGISLDQLLNSLRHVPVAERSGKHLVDSLEAARESAPVALPVEGPALQFLPLATYPQAVCWIGACIADALQYAHGRGLLHLDLKPSNVLLAGLGQPMLLDFHLARDMLPPAAADAEWLGGTPGYMSPEQTQAIAAIRQSQPIPAAVDGRSDIYSLGLLLYELLGGPPPDPADPEWRPNPSQLGVGLPAGIVQVVTKCLAVDPANRYAEAGTLSTDLRRCLVDASAANWQASAGGSPASVRPATRNWIIATALALAVVAIATNLLHWRNTAAVQPDSVTGHDTLAEAGQVEQQRIADDLHQLVDRLRFLDRLDSLPTDTLITLERGCCLLWLERSRFTSVDDTGFALALEQQVHTDLLDLAILWADLHVRLAPPGELEQARRDALQVLAEAERELGGSVVLSHERQIYAAALGLTEDAERARKSAESLTPQTGWEHYAMGRSWLRAGDLKEAAGQFREAVEHDPQSFWPNFYLGIAAYRQQQFEVSLAAFSACVAIRPEQPECFLDRGLAYQALGCEDLASLDFATAERLDPLLPMDQVTPDRIRNP